MAVYNDLSDDERVRVYDRAAIPPEECEGPLSRVAYHLGDVVSPFVAFPEPLAVEDQHFIDCVRSGSRPSTDGYSGLNVVRVLESAQLSLRRRCPVAMDETPSLRPGSDLAETAAQA